MPCKTAETYPPFFPGHFLSGSDNGRDRLIRAWFGLPWYSRYLALSGDSRTILRRDFVAGSESNSGRKMSDFDHLTAFRTSGRNSSSISRS